ncbi:MAG: cardiolipin synthase B [Proteobacteria bacterium]|nr:cardiolipin synthase B [Burkholderiales bacterium]
MTATTERLVLLLATIALASCAVLPTLSPATQKAAPATRGERAVAALSARTGDTLLERHLADTETVLGSPIVAGNAARILVDGPQTHAEMFIAIRAAREHINMVSYIVEGDEVGARFAEALIARRRAGVTVNLMYDSVGSMATPTEYFARLRAAGVNVCEFNPVNPARVRRGWRVNNRDHRKILVVDGHIGFAGGINVSSVYSAGSFGSGRRRAAPDEEQVPWRDTHVEIRGPAVAEMQRSFIDIWQQQRCSDLGESTRFFPKITDAGRLPVRIVTGGPERSDASHYLALLSAFTHAEQRIYITCGYFVPDPQLARALMDAAQRGVDVRLLLPSVSDFWAPLAAGRSHYAAMLAAGVKIYERKEALLHAKTAVVDGVWSTIGSTNLDFRSFVHNEEANVVVFDDKFAGELERLFHRDLKYSEEVNRDQWSRRGIGQRLQQWFARQFDYLL